MLSAFTSDQSAVQLPVARYVRAATSKATLRVLSALLAPGASSGLYAKGSAVKSNSCSTCSCSTASRLASAANRLRTAGGTPLSGCAEAGSPPAAGDGTTPGAGGVRG